MLINIHELSSLASILIITGLLSTVSSKLESAIVKEHRRVSLCCIIVLSKHMIGYWLFVKECQLDRILSSQGPSLPSITSLSRFFFLLPSLRRERLVASPPGWSYSAYVADFAARFARLPEPFCTGNLLFGEICQLEYHRVLF